MRVADAAIWGTSRTIADLQTGLERRERKRARAIDPAA